MTALEGVLSGLLVTAIGALVYVVKHRQPSIRPESPTVAQVQLIQDVKDHVDEAERRLHENINNTRHAIKDGQMNVIASVVSEIKEKKR